MAQFASAGYQDIRTYVGSNWNYIRFWNSSTSLFTIPTTDPRVTKSGGEATNPLVYTIVLTGADTEIASALPMTITGVSNEKTATLGSAMTATETFTSFTFTQPEDKLTITFSVEIPQI